MGNSYISIILLFIALMGLFSISGKREIKESVKITDGKLKIYGFIETYDAPPENISPEIALQIIRGEIPSFVVDGVKTTKSVEGIWFLPRIETTVAQIKVSWSDKHWISTELPPKKLDRTLSRYLISLLAVWVGTMVLIRNRN